MPFRAVSINISLLKKGTISIKGPDPMNIDKMIDWSLGALDFFKTYYKKNKEFIDSYAYFPSNHLSLVRKDGALDLYHGVLARSGYRWQRKS